MERTDLTVIIDTYNYGQYISKAIESAVNQSFPKERYEILVVDDGSTDNTKEVVEKYKDKVTYIYKKNEGQASSFNEGFKHAKGEIICLLDADDEWFSNKLIKVYEIFEKNSDVGYVRHYMQNIDESSNIISNDKIDVKLPADNDLENLLKQRIYAIGSSALSFRKSHLEKILPIPKELFICPDEYLCCQMLFNSKLKTIPEYLAKRRLHKTNSGLYIENVTNPEKLENYIKIRKLLDDNIKKTVKDKNIKFKSDIFILSDLNIDRSEILLERLRTNAFKSFRMLVGKLKKYDLSLYVLFKFSTFLLIVVSPKLYTMFFGIYYKFNDWR